MEEQFMRECIDRLARLEEKVDHTHKQLMVHTEDAKQVRDRVITLEIDQEAAKRVSRSVATTVGAIVSAMLVACVELFKKLFFDGRT